MLRLWKTFNVAPKIRFLEMGKENECGKEDYFHKNPLA
jgi:hypothetical protein